MIESEFLDKNSGNLIESNIDRWHNSVCNSLNFSNLLPVQFIKDSASFMTTL